MQDLGLYRYIVERRADTTAIGIVSRLEINAMLQSNRLFALSASCCLLALASSGCATTGAQNPANSDGILRKKVSYVGLDLDSAAGAQVLFRRIKFAAEEVCEPLDGQSLEERLRWRACYERSFAAAVKDVNRPQVTALYRATGGQGHFP